MEIERIKRYKDKMDLIEERINDLNEWLTVSFEIFMKDKKLRLASYKAFQEIVEASMDIIAMMVRDLNLLVKDDYSNISTLFNKNCITFEL